MAFKRKEILIVEEAPVVEEVPAPTSYVITLDGPKGTRLTYGINGKTSSLPCGEELTVSPSVYGAVQGHTI
jgi:hypothetical protein